VLATHAEPHLGGRPDLLETLRQPIESGVVHVARVMRSVTFPARVMLVGAMNPCPCGNYMDPVKKCVCSPFKVQHYWSKLSGPLLDRIDLHIEVPRLKKEELISLPDGDTSKVIRGRVAAARKIQQARFMGSETLCNARMLPRQMREFCRLEAEAEEFLKGAILHLQLSGRAYDRILKVARTIADLDASEIILSRHIAEAAQYRAMIFKGGN